ncbi:MAG: LamG domain-containing protein [Planctomycetota bacterium]|jgi:hypothetical protein
MRTVRTLFLLPLPFLLVGALHADTEVMDLDPLSEKDLSHFKIEGAGGWAIDDVTDDVDTLLVCPRAKGDTSLVFVKRSFKQGFLVSMRVTGGTTYKKLGVYVVPEEGDWILVPMGKRMLARKGWQKFSLKVEKGEATVKVGDEWGESVTVPDGDPLRFAFKLPKGGEAIFKKMRIKFLVVAEAQAQAEEGFVRIFDGKSMDGWRSAPDELRGAYKLADERIEGRHPDPSSRFFAELHYSDGVFQDFILKFSASSDSTGLHLMARQPRQQEEQNQCIVKIDDYFLRDRDWNDVTWDVKGKTFQLRIGGRLVLNQTAPHNQPIVPRFMLIPRGKCTLRDIRIKGQNTRPGPSWNRYVRESGVTGATGGASRGGRAGAGAGPATRPLFNGKDLTDWRFDPITGAWSVAQGRILGITKERGGVLQFRKWVFPEYRLVFKVEKGSKGVTFVASALRNKAPVEIALKDEWLTKSWNEFEAVKLEGKFTLKANGKMVHTGKIHTEGGAIAWKVAPNSALGIKDIVWHRP